MKELHEKLRNWAERYETVQFIKEDPVQIPHHYDSKVNIEISAFVTAWLSWGSRSQIIKKALFVNETIFRSMPYHYIVGEPRTFGGGNEALSDKMEVIGYTADWEKYKGSTERLYRTYTYGDFYHICERLAVVYRNYPDMETYLKEICQEQGCTALTALRAAFGMIEGIPNTESTSACKRLCMFLRWMIRPNPVDFGLWDIQTPGTLLIPLDTHVHRIALKLGLTTRRTPDIYTARGITDCLDAIFPGDPCKGDFALFGYGVDNLKKKVKAVTVIAPVVEEPEFNRNVADLTISDVLQLRMFYKNLEAVIRNLVHIREEARRKANAPLLSHPMDKLKKKGLLDAGRFTVEYAEVLNKVSKLPSSERRLIDEIGGEAFNNTMKFMIDNEKKRVNGNREDQ